LYHNWPSLGETGSVETDSIASPKLEDSDVMFVRESLAILLADITPDRPSVPSSLPPVTILFAILLVIIPIILFINL
jgi:hypothetical protein